MDIQYHIGIDQQHIVRLRLRYFDSLGTVHTEIFPLLMMDLAGNGRECTRDDLGCSIRSEEHTSELQSLMRISYAVFCLKKKNKTKNKYHKCYYITKQQN